MRNVLLALALGFVVAHSRPAFAGCFTTCDIELSRVKVEPELGCLFVDPMESECICGIWLTIHNACGASVERVTGRFQDCGAPNLPREGSCSSLAPGEEGRAGLGVRGDGFRRWTIPVVSQGVEHRVMVEASVENFDDSPGCGCPFIMGSAANEHKPGPYALATFSLGLLLWRRRARGDAH